MEGYVEERYHQPSDEYDPAWSLEGSVQMGRVVVQTAERLAGQQNRPQWNQGDPFAQSAARTAQPSAR